MIKYNGNLIYKIIHKIKGLFVKNTERLKRVQPEILLKNQI